MFYWIAFYFFRLMQFLYFPTKVYGYENIPRTGAFIYASNHISNLDPLLLGLTANRRISYMAKNTLFKNPIANMALRGVDAFPLNRESGDVKSLREALRRLKAGRPLVVFPTGTRTAVDAKAGVGFLVSKARVPVIAAKVIDTDKVLIPGKYWFRRHPVTIILSPPLRFAASDDYETIAEGILETINVLKPMD